MECTQRLECTQDLYESTSEKTCPEQIGFLGICGTKYPVKKGPNKIGRDPQTCNIVLQLDSVSRQHAVINILNKTEFMLMDLDSANKTKILDKTLSPYIPHPLKNGDTVQFGKIFGVFRLLEEDNDLPMTQALDVPDTPVACRMVPRIHVPITTIPESPDVSDRDDSFIAHSQPKNLGALKKDYFIKPCSKVISIQPVGSNKIDNIYWNSSKKSTSLDSNFDESNQSLNESAMSVTSVPKNNVSVHEMETQVPFGIALNESVDSIYTANTQLPNSCNNASPSIHSLATQMPACDNLPEVCKIDNQREVELDLFISNKENDNSIHNAETQDIFGKEQIFNADTEYIPEKEHIFNAETQYVPSKEQNISTRTDFNDTDRKDTEHVNGRVSEEEILFDDIDNAEFQEEFESQSLLPESPNKSNKANVVASANQGEGNMEAADTSKPHKRNVRIQSDSSTDCDDFEILPTQKLPVDAGDDDLTDCEDPVFDKTKSSKSNKITNENVSKVNFEDMLTQVLEEDMPHDSKLSNNKISDHKTKSTKSNNLTASKRFDEDFEDMLTQKIENEPLQNNCEDKLNSSKLKCVKICHSVKNDSPVQFEDMLTQVIEEDIIVQKNMGNLNFEETPTQKVNIKCTKTLNDKHDLTNFEDLPTQILCDNVTRKIDFPSRKEIIRSPKDAMISPFKIPLISPIKVKRKDILKSSPVTEIKSSILANDRNDLDDKYYAATQEIIDDLCTQPENSPEVLGKKIDRTINSNDLHDKSNEDDEVVPCSVEGFVTGNHRFPGLDDPSPNKKSTSQHINSSVENINQYVNNLSAQEVRDVIGVDVVNLKRQTSDVSDVDTTPKKVRPLNFMEIDLPNSQEIKSSVTLHSRQIATESSSESETENDSEEQFTPILFRNKKKKPAIDAKIDLTKKFALDILPTRVITRIRKPTIKLQNSDDQNKKGKNNILKPTFLTEQEGDIDKEIINENISRLKNKNEKSKHKEQKNRKENLKIDDKIIKNVSNSTVTQKIQVNKTEAHEDTDCKTGKSISKSSRRMMLADKEIETVLNKLNTDIPEINKKINTDIPEINKKLNTDIPEINKRSTRRTRNKKSDDKDNKTTILVTCKDKKSVSSDKIIDSSKDLKSVSSDKIIDSNHSKGDVKRSRRKAHKKEDKHEPSPENEVRRSRRHRSSKEKNDSIIKVKINKPSKRSHPVQHEQSTVYTISSDSGTDSPKGLKRSAAEVLRAPSPKRTRSTVSSNSSLTRSTPAQIQNKHFVLFTAFPCDEVKVKLEKLGAVIVTEVTACTVLLTMHFKRTFKLLCAVGLGRPIVGPSWVQACADNNTIVDPWLYLIKDQSVEDRFKFNLQRTLVGKRNFLKGYNVSSTPSVMPSALEMKLIVECSGGTWKAAGPQWLCVSCSADKSHWPALKKQGATIVSTEFILGGVLRQKLDISANKIG